MQFAECECECDCECDRDDSDVVWSPQHANGYPFGSCSIRASSSGVRKDERPAANPTARDSKDMGTAYRKKDDDEDDAISVRGEAVAAADEDEEKCL